MKVYWIESYGNRLVLTKNGVIITFLLPAEVRSYQTALEDRGFVCMLSPSVNLRRV